MYSRNKWLGFLAIAVMIGCCAAAVGVLYATSQGTTSAASVSETLSSDFLTTLDNPAPQSATAAANEGVELLDDWQYTRRTPSRRF